MMRLTARRVAVALLTAAVACHDGPTKPNGGIGVGESFTVTGAQRVTIEPKGSDGRYIAVLSNTALTAGTTESYSLSGSGVAAAGSAPDLIPSPTATGARMARPSTLSVDRVFERSLRARERRDLTPRFAVARSAMTSRAGVTGSNAPPVFRRSVLSGTEKLGDLVTVNVNGVESCTNPIYHRARVAAIGTHSIILSDSLNPPGGFTDADYARYAARFDTLVYPLDVGAFGAPTDIDANGRVALVFTLEVNRLTANGSPTFIGGFTFGRDLFPITSTSRAQGCAGSNEGEYFYLLTPDPQGRVNGNRRTAGFVDSSTTAILAHEFQHLINASRRLYVNNAPVFEETWLDEGLAHIAEELLFYHEAGLTPRANLDVAAITATQRSTAAFNLDMSSGGNVTRYRSYLGDPSQSSPYAANDKLSTRGATWSLLRYLADHASATDGNIFFRLANGPATGIANLQAVFGTDLSSQVRDWSASHAVDDAVATSPSLQQLSWDWHDIFANQGGSYPLQIVPIIDGSTYSGSVVAGGAAFYRFAVPADGSAILALSGTSRVAGSHLQLVVVRIE